MALNFYTKKSRKCAHKKGNCHSRMMQDETIPRWEQRRKLNTHVLRKLFAQVSKTRRIPDRSGKDRRWMSVSQSQASY